jgi:hypothetical protein
LLAQTIAHELIHAEFFRQLIDAIGVGNYSGATTNEISIALANSDYTTLYNHYLNYRDWSHNFMANYYRETLASVTQEFDTGTPVPAGVTPDDLYMKLAWKGLRRLDPSTGDFYVQAWGDLTAYQRAEINIIINQYIQDHENETCP